MGKASCLQAGGDQGNRRFLELIWGKMEAVVSHQPQRLFADEGQDAHCYELQPHWNITAKSISMFELGLESRNFLTIHPEES